MAFALYQPNFLPAGAVVVPQRIYRGANAGGFEPTARIAFYDNGVPGVSMSRALAGTHLINAAKDVAPLTAGNRITLRLNVSWSSPRAVVLN